MAKRESFAVPLAATLVFHGLFVAGLDAAEHYVKMQHRPPPMEVTFEVQKAPPPPPPAPPPPPPPEPEPPKVAEPPKPTPRKRVVAEKIPPPPSTAPPPPAPGPPDEEPAAPQQVYVLPGGGQMAVDTGSPEGKPTGRPGGTGKGTGGAGGEPGVPGNGPKVVPLASVKRMPEAMGDYDLSKDYPDEAKRLGIEGEASVRLLVGEDGSVSQTKLVRGPGHGLNEKAVELGRKIRFKPALDESDRPVATWITWTFTFTLPR